MRNTASVLAAVLCSLLCNHSAAAYGNVIINGDFEYGLAGWKIATPDKPAYIYNDPPLSPQVYTYSGPVDLHTYQGTTQGSVAAHTPAITNRSLGWFRTGPRSPVLFEDLPGGFLYNYIYQDLYVVPGEPYTITSANWNAFSWNGYNNAKNDINEIAAMFIVRIDDQIDTVYDPNNPATYTFRLTTWNLASQGNWMFRQLAPDQTFTSTTGRVQVQLHFQDGYFERNYSGEYATVGFDDLSIMLDKPLVVTSVARIGQLWPLEDGSRVSLSDKLVTAVFSGWFVIQETDRSAAVKALSSSVVNPGDIVDITGGMAVDGGQRVVIATDVVVKSIENVIPSPVEMRNDSVGGKSPSSSTPGVTGGHGIYTAGLLASTTGVVTGIDYSDAFNNVFYISDGTKVHDGGLYPGLRVNAGLVFPPFEGSFVTVTGVCGLQPSLAGVGASVNLRSETDLVVH